MISVLVTGAENASLVREKVDLARPYEGMSATEQSVLIAKAADLADDGFEYYKRRVTG